MSNPIAMAAQLANQTARFGWYFGINRLLARQSSQLGERPSAYKPTRPVPGQEVVSSNLTAPTILLQEFFID